MGRTKGKMGHSKHAKSPDQSDTVTSTAVPWIATCTKAERPLPEVSNNTSTRGVHRTAKSIDMQGKYKSTASRNRGSRLSGDKREKYKKHKNKHENKEEISMKRTK